MAETEQNASQMTSYRSIAKGTAIFGGTQLASMAANIIKGKLSAHIIGAYGLGISAHLTSAFSPMQLIFSCGFDMSGSQGISAIEDARERAVYVKCFRRLIMLLATMAMVTTLASSWWLSQLTFGTTEHWTWFDSLRRNNHPARLPAHQGTRHLQYDSSSLRTGHSCTHVLAMGSGGHSTKHRTIGTSVLGRSQTFHSPSRHSLGTRR